MLVYINMDDVLCDFTGAYSSDIATNPGTMLPQSQHGFFAKLTPIEGTIDFSRERCD